MYNFPAQCMYIFNQVIGTPNELLFTCFIEQITNLFYMSCTACFILSDSSAIIHL